MQRIRIQACLIFCAAFCYAEVPRNVLIGILAVESSSYYKDGKIVYVDRAVGAHGEVGPFQVSKVAFTTVRRKGERFYDMQTDTALAECIASRYLVWLRKNHAKSWPEAIEMYNAGPNNRSRNYLRKVQAVNK